jgi:GntR family transcriptional regulator / MocR family aminotransferase
MINQKHELLLTLPNNNETLARRISQQITEEIRRGRLKAGREMPGSRTLAQTLGVHRNTVLEAYRELIAEGWLSTEQAKRTFVSESLPEIKTKRFSEATRRVTERPPYPLAPGPLLYDRPQPPPGALLLTGGLPDLRLLPTAPLARAYRRALEASSGDPRGHILLREALAVMLSSLRGLAITAEDIVVTRGSQMALMLAAKTLLSPGDNVAVEALGYKPAWEALRLAGGALTPIPVDDGGLSLEALERVLQRKKIRAIYVTPHHQYPTTATLSADRRLRLLALAKQFRFAILEDDYDHEFHYEGRPILPLASADTEGSVIYLGTLSKAYAPGLRIGYLVAPRLFLERATAHRIIIDRQGDQVVERAIASLIEDGELGRHIRKVKRVYQERRDILHDALQKSFGNLIEVEKPSGGIALWARLASIDVDAWMTRSLAAGVAFRPGSFFDHEGRNIPYARLGFAAHGEAELLLAVKKLKLALPKVSKIH